MSFIVFNYNSEKKSNLIDLQWFLMHQNSNLIKNSFQGTPLRDTDRFPVITSDSNAINLTYIVNELSKPTVVKVPMK